MLTILLLQGSDKFVEFFLKTFQENVTVYSFFKFQNDIYRVHGLYGPKLYDITKSLIISRIKYAAPSWCGFANNEHIKQLQSLLNKLIRLNYLPLNYPKIKAIFSSPDERLFLRVNNNQHHVLHQILPPVKSHNVICENERTITRKQFTPLTKTKHSFLVFSIPNKLIILIVHRF